MSSRIDKIRSQYQSDIRSLVSKQKYNVSDEKIWDTIISADPSNNNKHSRWIVETFLNKGFLWEDLSSGKGSKVYNTLKLFDRLKHNIEDEKFRSLIKYKTLGSIYASIKNYQKPTRVEERNEEKAKAYEETHFFYDNLGLKILTPKTVFASKYWGRGTQWCTSGDNDNRFSSYSKDGPLIIIITPEGRKFQAWRDYVDNETVYFMDENDDDIASFDLSENWKYLQGVSYHLGSPIAFPEEIFSKEMCLSILKKQADYITTLLLFEANTDFVDEKFFAEAIEHNPKILETIYRYNYDSDTESLIDNMNCTTQDAYFHNLRLILKIICDPLYIKKALEYDISLLENIFDWEEIPESTILDQLQDYAISDYYQFLPTRLQTKERAKEAFEQRHSVISYIQKENQTMDIVNQLNDEELASNFKTINKQLLNSEHYAKIINSPIFHHHSHAFILYFSIDKMPETLINDDFLEGLKKIPTRFKLTILNLMPEKYHTEEYILTGDVSVIDMIKSPFCAILSEKIENEINNMSYDTLIEIGRNPKNISEINRFFSILDGKNSNKYKGVYGDINDLSVEEKSSISKEVWQLMVKLNPSKIEHMPKDYQTKELWAYIINSDTSRIEILPEEYHNLDFFQDMYHNSAFLLSNIRRHTQITLSDDNIDHLIESDSYNFYALTREEQTLERVKTISMISPHTLVGVTSLTYEEKQDIMLSLVQSNEDYFYKISFDFIQNDDFTRDMLFFVEKNERLGNFIEEYDLHFLYDFLTPDEIISMNPVNYNELIIYQDIQANIDKYTKISPVIKKTINLSL